MNRLQKGFPPDLGCCLEVSLPTVHHKQKAENKLGIQIGIRRKR
jgi:hypothetical protein